MNKEYIKWRHMKRLISSQEFFVWNNIEQMGDDDDFDGENFWSDEIQSGDPEYATIVSKSMAFVTKRHSEYLIDTKGAVYPDGMKIEDKIESTKKLVDEEKFILNPVFEYNDAIAEPFAYDAKDKILYYLSASSKTNLPMAIQPCWDYKILNRLEIPVENVIYYCASSTESHHVKDDLAMLEISCISTTKGGMPSSEDLAKAKTNSWSPLNSIVESPQVATYTKKDSPFKDIGQIDYLIEKIKEAKKVKKFDLLGIKKDLESPWTNSQVKDMFKTNHDILKQAIKESNPKNKDGYKYAGINGNVLRTKIINEYFQNGMDDSLIPDEVKMIMNLDEPLVSNAKAKIIEDIENAENGVVWYDFEGFSMPYCVIDGALPYHQIVFQVSVIRTENDKEVYAEDLVIDPKNLVVEDFYRIIETVYNNGADYYVVYNKGYEIPRMRTMIKYLRFHGLASLANEAEVWVDEIDNKTIDLMDLFKIKSMRYLSDEGSRPPIILDGQKGNASIKNVEKYISGKGIKMPRPIRQYANLNVKNGGEAMQTAIERYLGVIGDSKWESKVKDLKIYCENDVRAMIMVYDFAQMLFKKKEGK